MKRSFNKEYLAKSFDSFIYHYGREGGPSCFEALSKGNKIELLECIRTFVGKLTYLDAEGLYADKEFWDD